MTSSIYHEKQHLQFCAVHALNNLFQNGSFCHKQNLDDVCMELDSSKWMNPHRSSLQIGNYDINVISVFLQKYNYNVLWFDKRRSASVINTNHTKGFLINSVSPWNVLGMKLNISYFKHWYAITKINDTFFNLDSKLNEPKEIGSSDEVLKYMQDILDLGKSEILVVTLDEVKKEQVFNVD